MESDLVFPFAAEFVMTFRRFSLHLGLVLSMWSVPAMAQMPTAGNSGSSGSSQGSGESSGSDSSSSDVTAYTVESLNAGLEPPTEAINRSTPQATMELFMLACRDKNFERAAHALNLKFVPEGEQAKIGPQYAKQLYQVFEKKLWIDWEELPDRADGQAETSRGAADPLVGKARKNIRVGLISVGERGIPIRVQRVKLGEQEPVWVLSANTVDNIPVLYEEHGPRKLVQMMPDWAKQQFLDIQLWQWIGLALSLLISLAVGYGVNKAIASWEAKRGTEWADSLTDRIRIPAMGLATAVTFYLLEYYLLSLSGIIAYVLNPLLLVGIVMMAAWLASGIMDFLMQNLVKQGITDMAQQDEEDVQRMLTQLSVGRRLVTLIIVMIGFGILMLQLKTFQVVGSTLLASAGVLGLVIGFAARTVLGNVLAGLQVAITRPVRIGDSGLFEGNWGKIEDIGFTYLTVHTWDKRRIIIPLQHFISNPFENWSKTEKELTKPIYFYVDYRTDVEAIREEFARLCSNHELYDGEQEPTVQVTGVSEDAMELRALCSAETDSDAWTLHCDLREQMMEFITEQNDGAFLPRERMRITNGRPVGDRSEDNNGSTAKPKG